MNSLEDILYPFIKIYNSLPLSIRNFLGVIYRLLPTYLKYGSFYQEYFKRIKNFELSNKKRSIKLTNNLLFDQVNYAIDNIPYYRSHTKINDISDFRMIPIINKDIIRNNPVDFLNPKCKHKALKANTGGSSGTPLPFFIEKGVTRPKEKAHFNWHWAKFNYKEGDKVLMIRGKHLKNKANYEFQTIWNKLVVSCYNLNQDSIQEIYRQIHKFKPKFIHAYPSSLLTFTKELQLYLRNHNADFRIESIFLGSEYLFEEDKNYFEHFYDSKVVTWYGHSECLIHGAKCNISGDYHFFPFYGFIELVDENGNQIKKSGKEGRIIATGFDNKVMPLSRYDTGDLGILSPNVKCPCGFKGISLSKIIGRGKDYIILKDSTRVTLTAFIAGQHHEEFSKIKEMQIVQNVPGSIILKILPLANFLNKDKGSIMQKLINSVKKDSLSIEIQLVKDIEKTHRGKHKLLIQNIDLSQF